MTSTPPLQAPGAGLPFPENLLARYVMIPVLSTTTTWEKACANLRQEADRCRELTAPLDDDTMRRPVLIERFRGIEDSSRHWSPAMALRHLVIVGEGIAAIIAALREGRRFGHVTRIQDVKPEPESGPEQRDAFRRHVRDYLEQTAHAATGGKLQATHAHPWFGELNAHQWHCLASFHAGIHRKQIGQILQARP